jgi:hypothetical protein
VPDPQVEIAKEQAMTNELLEQAPLEKPAAKPAPAAVAAAPAPLKPAHKRSKAWVLLLLAVVGAGFFYWRGRAKEPAPQA